MTRKEALQEEIRKDLKSAGEYLQTNHDRIKEKIEKDIEECARVIAKEKENCPLDSFTAAQLKVAPVGTDWQKVADQQAIFWQELNGNGQAMVRLLREANIIH